MDKGIKIIIIGAVAAGTSAAAKIRRKSESAEIVIYEKDSYISYGTCGLPYFVSEKIKNVHRLVVNTVERFEKRFKLKVKTLHEVIGIDPVKKRISVKNLAAGQHFNDYFDRLIITTGSIPIKLKFDDNVENSENIFGLKTIDDAVGLKNYMDKIDRKSNSKKEVVIIGGGFTGLEILEAFLSREYKVSIVEKTSQILPMFDKEIIDYLESYLAEKEVNIYKGDEVVSLVRNKNGRVISVKTLNNETLNSDIIFLGVGTGPNVKIARDCGIRIGESGSITVDEYMRTNFKYIYAAGDCCECNNLLTGNGRSYNLANIAGRQGRVAGINAVGGREKFSGSVVNSIIEVLDVTIAKIGLSFKETAELDTNADFIEFHDLSHAGYYPGADMIHMIMIFNKKTGKILGFQAIGKSGVDKRVDIISTAMAGNLRIWELADLDLGYHPAYGSARDPINMLGLIAGNLKKGEIEFLSIDKLKEKIRKVENITILDVRTRREYDEGHIDGATLIHIDDLRKNIDKLDAKSQIIIYCETGYRAYQGFRILKNLGFKNVKVLNGSYLSWLKKI